MLNFDVESIANRRRCVHWGKAFYEIKNYQHLSTSEIQEAGKNLTDLIKSLRFKKFHGGIDAAYYDNYDDNYDFANDMKNTEKQEVLEQFLKSLIEIITNQ